MTEHITGQLDRLPPLHRRPSDPFSPSGSGGASFPAAGRASQIISLTSAIRSTIAVNSACRATSPRTLSAGDQLYEPNAYL